MTGRHCWANQEARFAHKSPFGSHLATGRAVLISELAMQVLRSSCDKASLDWRYVV